MVSWKRLGEKNLQRMGQTVAEVYHFVFDGKAALPKSSEYQFVPEFQG